MDFFEKTKDSETVYSGRIVTVKRDKVELSDKTEAAREVVEHPGGVVIAAIDDAAQIYVVDQFRYPMQKVLTELPAGKLEWGEDPDKAAERELREETGLTAKEIKRIGEIYPSPGYCGEILYLYLATGLTQGEQELDEGELLRCRRIPFEAALEMVLDNTIKDAKSIALISMAKKYLES